jgi:glycosyltransferase involved in cell wall biosynthesis
VIRLAFLLPHLRPGGAERVVVNWLGALDRTRFAPVLMLGKRDGGWLAEVPADVTVVTIGGARALTRPLRIARALREHRIDLAYSATSAMNLALLAAPTRARRIVSEHTMPGAFRREAKWPLLRALATAGLRRRADAVAVPTQAIADELGGAHVIPNPVLAHVPDTLPPPRTGTHIVAAGRLVPAKGFATLIDAAALLAREGVPFTLAIHGDGPLHGALTARIAQLGLAARITLAGYGRLDAALARADLLVSSSHREGFGNVLVEAMAAGTPVLATRSGGPESFIADGVNGFLCPAGDAAALARAMAALLADPAHRNAVRAAALDTARGYTIARSTAAFARLAAQVARVPV